MKRFIFLIGIFSVISCKNEVIKTDSEIKQEVTQLLDEWHLAAAKADFNSYMNKMADGAIFVGTAAEEHWTKEQFGKFSKPYFDKGKAWNFTPLQRNLFIDETKKIIWFDELLDTWMGICRGSGIVENTTKGWKIKHYVLSVTVPNEDIKKVIENKAERESLILKKLKKEIKKQQ